MQTTAIGTVANSLPENEVILLTLLSSKEYILFATLRNKLNKADIAFSFFTPFYLPLISCSLKSEKSPSPNRL